MKDVYGKPLPPSQYEKNETMKLLGHQCMVESFWCNDEVRKQVKHIAEGRPCSFTIDAAADIFALGFIHGKRAERARRKAKKQHEKISEKQKRGISFLIKEMKGNPIE